VQEGPKYGPWFTSDVECKKVLSTALAQLFLKLRLSTLNRGNLSGWEPTSVATPTPILASSVVQEGPKCGPGTTRSVAQY